MDAVFVVADESILEPFSSLRPVLPKFSHPGFKKYGSPLKIFVILSTISIAVSSLLATTRIFLSG